MSLTTYGAHRLTAPVLLALLALAPSGCGFEVTLCQAEGMKYETPDGMLQVWVNPILYVRNYGDGLFETTNVVITVLNGSEVVVPPQRYANFTTDPGGEFRCPRTNNAMGSSMTGIAIPRMFPRNARLALSVKVELSDTTGTARSFTAPVTMIRYAQEGMPSFSCSSTRCGR
jgi:hypothetical protein